MPKNNKITGTKKVAQATIIKKMLMEKLGRCDYGQFITSLYMDRQQQITKYIIDDILYNYNEETTGIMLHEVINNAFCWCASPGGHEFWRKKDNEWREYVDQSLTQPEFKHIFKKTIG